MIRTLLITVAAATVAAGTSDPAICQTGTQPYSATVFGSRIANRVQEDWTYTLANTSDDANYTVWLLQIEVDEATQALSAVKPTGWAVDLSVPNFVTWIAPGKELTKGEVNDGFGITFSANPEYQNWSAMFNNIGDPSECPSDGGIVRMAAVPEPAGLTSILVGLAGLVCYRRKSNA